MSDAASQTIALQALTVDPSEKNGPVVKYWLEYAGLFPDLVLEYAELEAGDFLLAPGVAVERKSATDFLIAVMDQRLPETIARLKSQFDRPLLLVEGDIFQGRFHSNPKGLREALAYVTVVEGVPFVPSSGPPNTAELLYEMARQAQIGPPPAVLRRDKPRDPVSGPRYLVEGLPHVGETLAKRLLAHFGSAAAVFAAPAEALAGVEGVTPEAAARMRKMLDAPVRR